MAPAPERLPESMPASEPSPRFVRRRLYADDSARVESTRAERSYGFEALHDAPLVIDAVYCGGSRGDVRDDPIARLIPGTGNQGGFRPVGGRAFGKCRLLVLSSSGIDPDWPDRLDAESGTYTYYGDNKKPGFAIHETPRGGNQLLQAIFAASTVIHERTRTPPVFVFTSTGTGRDVMFRGLAVPSASLDDGLVAVWRQSDGRRFQNYRAQFDILRCTEIPRAWIDAICSGAPPTEAPQPPKAWKDWVRSGRREVLRAPRTVQHRTREQQMPDPDDRGAALILESLRACIAATPHDFEFLAAEIFRMIEPRVFDLEITRRSADGGRDAVGRIRIGGDESESDGIFADFALEAKAFQAESGLGVKETSRLISRLRHRQFGVIVTTSFVSAQAYRELREDRHPVIIVSGGDVVRILRKRGIHSPKSVKDWASAVLENGVRRA